MKRKTQRPFDYMAPHMPAFERPPEADAHVDAAPDNDLAIAPEPKLRAARGATDDSITPLRRTAHGATAAEAPQRPILSERPKSDGTVYAFAILFALAMAIAPAAFWIGAMRRVGPFQYEPFTFGLLALLGAGMAGLALSLAYSLRQGARLAAEANLARRQAEDMLQPALLAAAGAGSALEAVRIEIDNATAATDRARQDLAQLSQAMATETERLLAAATASSTTATSLTAAFAHEREGLGDMATQLDRQILEVGDAIGRQAKMVAEASDLAEAQMREAEAALTARAAEMVSAAGQTTDSARVAGEDLSRQAARLETAAASVTEQINALEGGLGEQRAGLVALSQSLRADHEDFATQIESQQAQLSHLLQEAHASVATLQDITHSGSETARGLIADVADQYRELTTSAAGERDRLSTSTQDSISALSQAMDQHRDSLSASTREAISAMTEAAEAARVAAAAHAEAARNRVDELGEAAFAAGQKADVVFEARLTEAQALIAQSADLVDAAGRHASERMAGSLQSAKDAAVELEALIGQIETRSANLPAATQARSDEVKAVIDQGVEHLLGAARQAAAETQAIDEAFQERVRRNYEMLGEAVRLMGVVSGAGAPPRSLKQTLKPEPAPEAAPTPELEAAPEPEVVVEAPAPTLSFRSAFTATSHPMAEIAVSDAQEPAAHDADDIGLRPRLRLTSSAADDMFEPEPGDAATVGDVEPDHPPVNGHDAAEPLVADDGEGWSWKDLLSSIDDKPGGPDRLGERMLEEVEALGIDPSALMPGGRIDQIAAVIRSGDRIGAREVVRRLAPAAVRRLSRRVMADIALRSQTDRFLRRYEDLISQTGDSDVEALAEVLATDPGRAFLLMDTAVGGLA